MLFWETLQCNKSFRAFVVEADRAHDFLILILFYALENREDPSQHGLVRMCVFVLQTLSAERRFGRGLNQRFESQGTLPTSIRLEGFRGSYADYLIIVSLAVSTSRFQGLTSAVDLQAHDGKPRQAACHIPSPACHPQQRGRLLGKSQRGFQQQIDAALLLHVVPFLPSGQRDQPQSAVIPLGGHQCDHRTSIQR